MEQNLNSSIRQQQKILENKSTFFTQYSNLGKRYPREETQKLEKKKL